MLITFQQHFFLFKHLQKYNYIFLFKHLQKYNLIWTIIFEQY